MIDNIIFFGIGAAGSNLAMNVAKNLPLVNIGLVDYDRVEARNIFAGTQAYVRSDIHKFKTQALSNQIYLTTADAKRVRVSNCKVTSTEQLLKIPSDMGFGDLSHTLFVDCFDDESRNLFHGLKIPVLHVGFSVLLTGEVCWNESWNPISHKEEGDEFDICTHQGAGAFIVSLTGIATMIINEYYTSGVKKNAYFDKYLKLKIF